MGFGSPFPLNVSKKSGRLDRETLYRLGGVTGLGWTTSVLGYASTVIGIGSGYVSRLVTDPQSFLYAGGVLFLATLGLDTLARRLDE
jgi:hypothetical protein